MDDRHVTSLTAVVSRFPAPSQTFIRRKLMGLRDAGMDVRVAATVVGDASSTGLEVSGLLPWGTPTRTLEPSIRRAWGGVARGIRSTAAGSLRSPVASLVQAPVASMDTDWVHFEFSGIAITYATAVDVLRRGGTRIGLSCRGAAEQIEPLVDPRRATQLCEAFERADLIHCVSDDMRRTVEGFGAPPERILVNRPAVPVADFAPLRRREPSDRGQLRVLSVGRLHWKKGLDDGLRAVAGARDRGVDVTYRIVGEGDERDKLTFLIAELGLGDRATLLGSRDQEAVRGELDAADVLLLPSLSEGISNAVLEAMAAGRPVITTRCGGMDEVVDDGVDGLLVDVGDHEAMAEHLTGLAEDPERRHRLGIAAAERADREFDLSRQISRFLGAYGAS